MIRIVAVADVVCAGICFEILITPRWPTLYEAPTTVSIYVGPQSRLFTDNETVDTV